MDAIQSFDGIVFSQLENAPAVIRTGYVIFLDQLPPCACGTPSAGALLRAINALLAGGFAGVRKLEGAEPSAQPSLMLTYSSSESCSPLWLWIDQESIEGKALRALLHEIKSGTTRGDRELAAHAICAIGFAYAHAGRSAEFFAAAQGALDVQKLAGGLQ